MSNDNLPIDKVLNLGPACRDWLRPMGIKTLGDLQKIPLEELYENVKRRVPQCNGVFLYAVFGALTDTHWQEVPKDVKTQLLETARTIDRRIRAETGTKKGGPMSAQNAEDKR